MKDLKSDGCKYVASHIADMPKSGIRQFFDIINSMKDVISLGVGEPDFVTPLTIRRSGIDSLERGHTAYTSNYGMLELRQEICKYLRSSCDVDYDPESECFITVGVSEAFDVAVRALINPGDEVLLVEPCYVSYPACVHMAHGVPVTIPTYEKDAFALDPEVLRSKITPRSKVLLLNFPCNPTGAVLPIDKMRKIAEIVIEHDLIVISDEVYSELYYGDEPYTTIASLPGMKERTIFLHGFSKSFAMTGWRLGYACGPADIIDAMVKIHQYVIMCAPTTAQDGALAALRYGRPDMEKMRESYRKRRDILVDGFNRIGLPCLCPKGTFYVFPRITSTGLSSMDFSTRLLAEEKVAVVPGTAFGDSGEGFIRVCYATGTDDIKEALKRIGRFVNSKK